MNLLKKNFFELGVAFGQFSAKPVQDNYETICKTVSPLELELPDYDNLKNQLWWNFIPPAKWFMGSDDESLRCGKIIETLLAHAYEWLTGENPVERQLAFNRVRNRLYQNHNMLLDDAVE